MSGKHEAMGRAKTFLLLRLIEKTRKKTDIRNGLRDGINLLFDPATNYIAHRKLGG
jgi:hypothetical protein